MRTRATFTAIISISLCAAAGWLGCSARPDTTTGETTRESTRDHFAHAAAIREALIRGDLEAARAAGGGLAEEGAAAAVFEGWEEHAGMIRRLGDSVAVARDADELGLLLGRVARACGSCHERVDRRPPPAEPTAPYPDSALHLRMLRHEWAADRLWQGLVGPSEDTWFWGAYALTQAPFTPERIPDRIAALEIARTAVWLHRLGLEALGSDEWQGRDALYGHLVGTCASCHDRLGVSFCDG